MIRSWKSKGLKELNDTGTTRHIQKNFHARIIRRLDALKVAKKPEDMNLPGFDFHGLAGFKPKRFTVHVNGPWCITFEFENGDAYNVNFEQYH
ncbi:type II toxin-antitoxin system RelE/ParE family toxin [Taklimakanibacter deserti]|uniref:type II toxin-antitoxin system RelE/ParE family toxin n=1 Tax=Taklimakanibacter deserti TaxID=2267839 RepID=UPI000E6491BB